MSLHVVPPPQNPERFDPDLWDTKRIVTRRTYAEIRYRETIKAPVLYFNDLHKAHAASLAEEALNAIDLRGNQSDETKLLVRELRKSAARLRRHLWSEAWAEGES